MPKGVEHSVLLSAIGNDKLCWISDAERRWAQIITNCFASFSFVLNLWCRKALSTPCNRCCLYLFCCVESLMPKGVEHFVHQEELDLHELCWISDAERRWAHPNFAKHLIGANVLNLWCRKALSTLKFTIPTRKYIRVESLMPKGVEHTLEMAYQLAVSRVLNLWCRKALSTLLPRSTH